MAEESDAIGSIDSLGAVDTVPTDAGTPSAPTRATAAPDVQQALSQVNSQLAGYSRVLELTVDATSGLTVATVRNSATGAVLSQFPGANQLQLAAMLAKWAGSSNALVDLVA